MSSDNNTLDPESAQLNVPLGSSITPEQYRIPPDWLENSRAAMEFGATQVEQWLMASTQENLWCGFSSGRSA